MDIVTFSEQLQSRMKEQMEAIAEEGPDELATTAQIMNVIRESIHDLEQFTYNYTFKDQQEEIRFFKEVKPIFVSQYHFHSNVFSIRLFESYNDLESRKEFYSTTLKRLEVFARKNRGFYLYCMTNSTFFDDKYFTRKGKLFSAFGKEPFATPFDEKLAKILAHEMLKTYLQETMRKLNPNGGEGVLTWTASKTKLIELGIALQAVGAFNNGSVDIKHIFEKFERIFGVDLKSYYRIFLQIRGRKKGQTVFIDQLKEKLMQKISDVDEI
jgi:hypothetical protein